MDIYDTKNKLWSKTQKPTVSIEEIRALFPNVTVIMDANGIIAFEPDLSPVDKIAAENLLNNKKV